MAVQSAHRTRAHAILTEAYGDSGHTLASGAFVVARKALERLERSAVERAVEVVFAGYKPLGGYNNPLDGRDLSTREVTVRVGYVLDEEGDGAAWDRTGPDSGAADRDSVEDRAEMDAKLIRDALSWNPSWSGLDPEVIDCAPHPEGDPPLTVLSDRAIREVRFVLLTKATLPGSYGPSA